MEQNNCGPPPPPLTNSVLARELCQLKALVRAQTKQICMLAKQVKANCKREDEDGLPLETTLQNLNPCLKCLNPDILYHLSLDNETTNFPQVFGDVRFVVVGGTKKRMEQFAHFIMNEIGLKLNAAVSLKDLAADGHRFAMFKVGPVLCASHGIGCPSISILLHELFKMMYHAKCQNPVFMRIGTCGGLGIEGGTVVITSEALNGFLIPNHEVIVQGKSVQHPTYLDPALAKELKSLTNSCNDPYDTIIGKTMCTHDFYEGQSRLDGAFCDYTAESKIQYLKNIAEKGVTNIEMESSAFAALTNRAGIRAAVVCVVIINRLEGDQLTTPPKTLSEWEQRPQDLVARYIRQAIYGSNADCEYLEEHESEIHAAGDNK